MTDAVLVSRIATPVEVATGDVPLAATLAPANAHTLVGATPASQLVYIGPTVYHGLSLRETSGTADAVVVVYDSTTGPDGSILDTISLVDDECNTVEHTRGRRALTGVWAEITGSVQGCICLAD